jgi:hypothetical protein
VLRGGLLLGSDLEDEVNEFYPQMGVLDLPVEHHGDAASKLHVKVSVLANVGLSLHLLEKLWHALQVAKHQLWQGHEIAEKLRALLESTVWNRSLIQETSEMLKAVLFQLELATGADNKSVRERE